MKKRLIFVLLAGFCGLTQAFSQITLSPIIDSEVSGLTANNEQIAKGRLESIISSAGIVAGEGGRFVLACKVAALSQNVSGTKIAQHLQVTIAIGDNINGNKFGAVSFETVGVGNSQGQAFASALRSINGNNDRLRQLIATSKQRIIDYYERNGKAIIAKARTLMNGQSWEEALYELSQIPSEASCYPEAMKLMQTVYTSFINHDAAQMLAEAQAIWSADPNPGYGAEEAMRVLAGINTSAACYPQAQALMRRIENRIKSVSDAERRTEAELAKAHLAATAAVEKARLKAIRDIGVAYASRQVHVYNYRAWW